MLAQRASIQMMRVDVHEVFLQFVRLHKRLLAAGAAVLGRHCEEVGEHVRLKMILTRERERTFFATIYHLK